MMRRRPIPKSRSYPDSSLRYTTILDGAVRVYPDGREVCQDSKDGWIEYKRRVKVMLHRQGGRCCLCNKPLALGNATFEHQRRRGMGAALPSRTGRQLKLTELTGPPPPTETSMRSRPHEEKLLVIYCHNLSQHLYKFLTFGIRISDSNQMRSVNQRLFPRHAILRRINHDKTIITQRNFLSVGKFRIAPVNLRQPLSFLAQAWRLFRVPPAERTAPKMLHRTPAATFFAHFFSPVWYGV